MTGLSRQPEDPLPVPAAQLEALLKLRRINSLSVFLVLVFGVLNLFPNLPGPLLIVKLALGVAGVITIATGTFRYLRWTRDLHNGGLGSAR